MAERLGRDAVLDEALRVLGHASFFEPVPQAAYVSAPSESAFDVRGEEYLTNALT